MVIVEAVVVIVVAVVFVCVTVTVDIVVAVILNVGPRNQTLQFGQNCVINSLNTIVVVVVVTPKKV